MDNRQDDFRYKRQVQTRDIIRRSHNTDTWEDFEKSQTAHARRMFDGGHWTLEEAEGFVRRLSLIWEGINNPHTRLLQHRCPHCLDQGGYIVPGVGFQQCQDPNCWKVIENNRVRYARWVERLTTIELAKYYRDYTLESWLKLPSALRKGKSLAYAAVLLMSQSSDLSISSHDIYRKARVDIPEGRANEKKGSLVLWGDVGVGKTGLVVGLSKALEHRAIPFAIVRASEMLRQIKECNFKKDETMTATDMLRLFQGVPFLVIDEMGMEAPSDADLQYMQEIVRHRHGAKLPTIMTTNLTPEDIYKDWHKQTADVLIEMAHCIHVGGEKLRSTSPTMSE